MNQTGPTSIEVSCRRASDIEPSVVDAWQRLTEESLEPNPFLSPSFVLPAIEELSRADDVVIASATRSVRRNANERALCGLAVFTKKRWTPVYPVPHLSAFKSPHSYLTGMILDGSRPDETAEALIDALRATMPRSAGLHFRDLPSDGPTARILRALTDRRSWHWLTLREIERPYLDVRPLRTSSSWDAHISSNRRKKYRRCVRQLSDEGQLTWLIKQGKAIASDDIAAFLQLENTGWKAEHETSLLSTDANRKFFERASRAFSDQGELLLTELQLDGVPIASSCNFRAGRELFAFKVGFNPLFSRFSPGIVNELKLLEHLATGASELVGIDSGAEEDSFIGAYWPGRKTLVNATISFGTVGHSSARLALAARTTGEFLVQRGAQIAQKRPSGS